ncbi:MAG: hypothetical protein WCS56_05120 [Bacilli bacterium]
MKRESVIIELEYKTDTLIKRLKTLIDEKHKLNLEIAKLETEKESLLRDNNSLKNKIKTFEVVNAIDRNDENAKSTINQMLREIEKCITLLKK